MNNQIAKKFDTLSLLKFTLPSMIMMLFMALYQMVDAVFVSNFVSETALSALNIVYPLISFIIAVAVMLATGGSAVIAKKMGEGEPALARQLFSMVVLIGVLFGIAMTLVGIFFTRPLIHLMGSTPALDPYCYDYLYTLMLFSPFAVLQLLFQTFFITAGKPSRYCPCRNCQYLFRLFVYRCHPSGSKGCRLWNSHRLLHPGNLWAYLLLSGSKRQPALCEADL